MPLAPGSVKFRNRFLPCAQLTRLLKHLHPFLLEHHLPPPAQLFDRLQERALHVPGIDGQRVEKANAVNPAHPAQQPQRGSGLGFLRANGLQVQQHIEFRSVELRKHIAMIADYPLTQLCAAFDANRSG